MASSGVRSRYRRALQLALKDRIFDANGDKIEFEGGQLDPPQERDIGCVWWEGKRPQARDGNNEENFYRVRLFRIFAQDQTAPLRVDQAEQIEQAADDLEDALVAVLTRPLLAAAVPSIALTDAPDFFVVTEVVTNYPAQYVEATLTAWLRNRTARGG